MRRSPRGEGVVGLAHGAVNWWMLGVGTTGLLFVGVTASSANLETEKHRELVAACSKLLH